MKELESIDSKADRNSHGRMLLGNRSGFLKCNSKASDVLIKIEFLEQQIKEEEAENRILNDKSWRFDFGVSSVGSECAANES